MSAANKELEGIDPQAVRDKAALDCGLTLLELSAATELPYTTVKLLAKEPNFPLIGGRVFYSDFKLWRRRHVGLLSASDTSTRSPRPAAGKSYAPRPTHG